MRCFNEHTKLNIANLTPCISQLSNNEIPNKEAWYSWLMFGLDRIKLFNKYGTVVWSLTLLFAISYDILGVIERTQESGKIIYVLELVDVIIYSIFIVLTPVSLYQLKKYSSDDRILATPLNPWIIVLTLISMATSGVMYVIGSSSTVFELLLDLVYPIVDSLCILTTILVFGCVFSGFKAKCTTMRKSENCGIEKYQKLLTEYQGLKRGSEFCLFTLFTCFTISLVIWTYLCLASVDNCYEKDKIISGFIDISALILCLVYFALAAHDCHSSFLELANHLR